jgi:hypothetical protein
MLVGERPDTRTDAHFDVCFDVRARGMSRGVRAKTAVDIREELAWAAADAHLGWMLYEEERRETRRNEPPTKHAMQWTDCTVPACRKRRELSEGAE